MYEEYKCASRARTVFVAGLLYLLLGAAAAIGQVPTSNHVFLLPLENHDYSMIVGNPNMPYLNSLISQYGLATEYYANTHPSIGNYFMLTTGQIITNNDRFTKTVTVDNVVRQILAAGKTWKSYDEALPSVGYIGDSYPYLQLVNPFSYFSDVRNSSTQRMNLVPFTQFAIDLANNQLPNYSFLLPSEIHNGHDCLDGTQTCGDAQILAAADQWLQTNIDPLIRSAIFQQGGDGMLIITFDEDLSYTANQVVTVIIGPKVVNGYRSTTVYQHQSALKLTCDALQIPAPGAGATAPAMGEFFSGTAPGPTPNPATLSTTSLVFAGQLVGTVSTGQTVTVTNPGPTALQMGDISVGGANAGDFSQTSNCPLGSTLAAAQSCAINVTFKPAATGARAALLAIDDAGTASPQTVSLSGTGVQPSAVLSPASHDFSTVTVGQRSSTTFSLSNAAGTAPLAIGKISISGARSFSQTNNCGTTLAIGAGCTIQVTFAPTKAGAATATLTVSDNAPGSPQTATLQGMGQ